MKITTKYLQKLIKEEIANVFNEQHRSHGRYPGSEDWGSPDDPRLSGLTGGQFSADEQAAAMMDPQARLGPLQDEKAYEILTMDIRHLLDVYREECPASMAGSGMWDTEQCRLAKERIRAQVGPTYE